MGRRPHIVRALLGLGVLFIGIVVYLLDRQPDHVYFLHILSSWPQVPHGLGPFWGPLGNWLPTFAHVYAFILISSALLPWGRVGMVSVCAAWLIIDSAFEVAQHPALAPWVAQAVPGWFAGVPFLENTASYVLNGTFDPLDLFSITIGTIAASVTIRLADAQEGQRCISQKTNRGLRPFPALVVLGVVGVLTITGSSNNNCPSLTLGICFGDKPNEGGTVIAVAERFPVVAVDGNGRALILSRGRVDEDPQKPVHLFASTYEFSTGILSPSTDLVTVGGSVQTLITSTHALAMDESGNGTALWSAFNGGLYANHFDQSAGWGQAALLSGATVSDYRIAMDGFGRALAVWAEGEDLFARDYPSSSSGWQDVRLVRNGPGLVLGDAVYQAFKGYAVWREAATSNSILGILYASRFTGNQGWELAQNFWDSNDNTPPRMALHRQAPSESPTAVWQDSGKILSAHLSPGVGWEVPEDGILGSDGGIRPQVVMAANLETAVVWEANGEIFASRFASGGWGLAERISVGATSSPSPRVATDATGNAIAVWRDGSTARANRFIRGTGWEGEQQIGVDLVSGGQPEVAMDNSGRVIVVWEGLDPADQSKTLNVRYVFEGFDLPPNPVTLDLASSPGEQASIFLTITRTGSSGAINISLIGCPANVTCAASPNPIPSGQSSTTVSFTSDATTPAAGDYDVTVEATGGGITRSKPVTLHIQGGLQP